MSPKEIEETLKALTRDRDEARLRIDRLEAAVVNLAIRLDDATNAPGLHSESVRKILDGA